MTTEAAALTWLGRLVKDAETLVSGQGVYRAEALEAWRAECEDALRSVFGPNHHIVERWRGFGGNNRLGAVNSQMGVLTAAYRLVAEGRLKSLYEEIRTATILDVLADAEELLRGNYCAAAMVLAGGALETHLRRMCDSRNATPAGHGSISKYADVLKKASAVTATEHKDITAWGGARNDAAHNPSGFVSTPETVELRITCIRQFIVNKQ